jgi:RNA polymerase sigma-70 factor (ECF subfamily)
LYHIAIAIVNNDEDAGDAISETIIKAYANLKKLKNPDYFKTWITRILINECRKILKQRRKIISLEDYPEKQREERQNKEEIKEEIMDLQIAIEQLPKRQKDVILLYYYDDLSIEEIALILEIPKGTVKSRLSTARNFLYEILSKEGRGKNAR